MTMKILSCAVAAGSLLAAAAGVRAEDAPSFSVGAPAAWVKPVATPVEVVRAGHAPHHMLLRADQLVFEPEGGMSLHWVAANQVVTPDDLAKLGTISLTWNPETETLRIHTVVIRRGSQVIDVLKDQHFTVLHRETNLERAAIDGRLTATLPIAGLAVGDIVEISGTRTSHDPALGRHHEARLNLSPGTMQTQFDAQWEKAIPIRWRALPGVPDPHITTGRTETLSISETDVPDPHLPKYAPERFRQADAVQFSDWHDFAEVSATMAPLYDKASFVKPGGAVEAEATRIAHMTADPVAQAEAALALVQEQVRYLYVGLNDGGYIPAAAEDTWTRRYGDCKGKTVLLLALLHQLKIEAQPVLVSAGSFGDAIPSFLPSAGLFNHVLVRAVIAGRTYWLDGTRMDDRHLADIRTPAFHWGLPVQAQGGTLVAMMPPPADKPLRETALRLDASAGFDKPVVAHAEVTFRGDGALVIRRQLAALSTEQRERTLRGVFGKQFDYIAPTDVLSRFDATKGEETLVLNGIASLDWTDDALELTGVQLGESLDLAREPGTPADIPYALPYPNGRRFRETIVLPNGGHGFTLDPLHFDQTVAGVATHRDGRIVNGVVELETDTNSLVPEFPASEAAPAQQMLRHQLREHAYLHRPPHAGAAS